MLEEKPLQSSKEQPSTLKMRSPRIKPSNSLKVSRSNRTIRIGPIITKLRLPSYIRHGFWSTQWKSLNNKVNRLQPMVRNLVSRPKNWFESKAISSWIKNKSLARSIWIHPYLPSRERANLRARHKPQRIHLESVEEHRCPYCLDIVEKNDPRGVKICPICHTYHHSDCWAVTGSCQVPHQHG